MEDLQVLDRIEQLVQEEEALLHRHEGEGLGDDEHARLQGLQLQLDKAYDYLRQRRALRRAGEDPDDLEGLLTVHAAGIGELPEVAADIRERGAVEALEDQLVGLLDHHGAQPALLCQVGGGHRPAAGSDHDDVEDLCAGHGLLLGCGGARVPEIRRGTR